MTLFRKMLFKDVRKIAKENVILFLCLQSELENYSEMQ